MSEYHQQNWCSGEGRVIDEFVELIFEKDRETTTKELRTMGKNVTFRLEFLLYGEPKLMILVWLDLWGYLE